MKSTAVTPQKKKRFRIIPVLIAALVVGVLLAGGGFAFAATQESHDPFCASCHSQPETTFVQRATGAAPVDLASYHTAQQTLCIDCHSGQGITGRMQAELMGARNAVMWFTGTATQPAPLNFPISDQSCLKCHQDVVQRSFTPKTQMTAPNAGNGRGEGGSRNNHWHQLMTRWQAADPNAGTCVTCHAGHATDGNTQNGFINDQNVQAACDACHRAIRRGD